MDRIKSSLIIVIYIFINGFVWEACTPEPFVNESELITSVYCVLHPQTGGDSLVLSFIDLDGDGGQSPLITGAKLNKNTIYNARLILLNETTIPINGINQEILNEAEDHQFFYIPHSPLDISIKYLDTDANGNPIGLETQFLTGNSSQGDLVITLKHLPDKFAADVKNGKIDQAGGETDIEIKFNLIIE